jgi:hypothetical protein
MISTVLKNVKTLKEAMPLIVALKKEYSYYPCYNFDFDLDDLPDTPEEILTTISESKSYEYKVKAITRFKKIIYLRVFNCENTWGIIGEW